MAKKKEAKAKGKAKAEPKKSNLPVLEKPAHGVPELASELGIEAAGVRVKLRAAGMKKDGRVWDFGNKKDFKALVKKLKAA